jgi:hypothetical protein
MKSLTYPPFERVRIMHQRGVVLFFALISLLAIMLAAVALIRSVDTSTMIAGNLAFKQAATTSGDAGTEGAIGWLTATQAANITKNVLTDTTHAFNVTNAASGYYANADPALSLFADATWDAITDIPEVTDSSGNKIRYVIQRTCRTPGVAIKDAGCLFSGAIQDTNGQAIPLPQDICTGTGCPVAGQTPMIRVTSRVKGPKNTVSYVQAFIY